MGGGSLKPIMKFCAYVNVKIDCFLACYDRKQLFHEKCKKEKKQ